MSDVTNTMEGKDYPEAISNAIERILTKAAIVIERDAVLLAPKATGRLQGSITYATVGSKSAVTSPAEPGDAVSSPTDKNTAHVGTNVKYAQHVEYGARGRAGRSFMRRSLDNNRARVSKMMQDEIREALERGR